MKFRIFGFPVTVNWSFIAVMALFGLNGERDEVGLLVWVVVAFVSILAHELGHAFAFRTFGYRSSIEFHFMGALTWPHTNEPIPSRREVLISVAGPLVGVVVGSLILAFHSYEAPAPGQSVLDRTLSDLAWANLGWGLFNLVPVFPLDGGRVMSGLLQLATGGRAQRAAPAISAVVATVLALASLALLAPVAAVLFGVLVWFNLRELVRTPPVPRHHDLEVWLSEGYDALETGAGLTAGNRARQVMAAAATDEHRRAAARLLAWAHLFDGRPDSGAEVIEWSPFQPSDRVLHPQVVVGAGGPEKVVKLLEQAFDTRPGPATGLLLVKALLEAGRLDDAVDVVTGSKVASLGNNPGAVVAGALFAADRFDEAAAVGEATWEHDPHPTLAYNVACSWARQGRPEETLVWLGRAVDGGYAELQVLDGDSDLDLVKGTPQYVELRQRVAAATR